MNAQLQAQLSQVLAQIMVSVGEVKDFSMEQLPDIVQQYVQYGIYSSIFYSVIAFLVLIVCVIGSYKIVKLSQRLKDDDILMLLMITVPIGVVSVLAFFNNIHSLILVLTAPKVWFILEIKNLLS